MRRVFVLLLGCVFACNAIAEVIDLTKLEDHEVKVLKNYSGTPKDGYVEDFPIKAPGFTRGICHDAHARYWRGGSNKIRARAFGAKFPGSTKEGTRFFLINLKDGRYLAFLPMGGDQAFSYLCRKESKMRLRLDTFSSQPLKGDVPLYSAAIAATPYEAAYKVWKYAAECETVKDAFRLREDKEFYEPSKYLGWISWGAFKKNINTSVIMGVIESIKASEVPIRGIMIDDGHQGGGGRPNANFKEGYEHLKNAYKGSKLKWLGLWYPFGSAPGGAEKEALKEYLDPKTGRPKDNLESYTKWWGAFLKVVKSQGIDYLKIDFHGGSPYRHAWLLNRGMEEASNKYGLPLIQCNWNYTAGHFASKFSVIARCTGDYFSPGGYRVYKAKIMPYDGHISTVYLGHIVWPDHDHIAPMGNVAGRMDCVRRAISGGGMFLYQVPKKFEQPISGVCYQDGLMLRPLAPAVATVDNLFRPIRAPKLFVAMAPLPNKAAVFHVMNLDGPDLGSRLSDPPEHEGRISLSDYQNAGGMIQPYRGLWPVPEEGLYMFEQFTGKGQLFDKEYLPKFAHFTDQLIQLSPIVDGWSIIGRTDKYLSAAAVEVLARDKNTLNIKLHEAGPFAVYSRKGKPKAKGLQFKDAGNGLYKADIPIGELNKAIVIER